MDHATRAASPEVPCEDTGKAGIERAVEHAAHYLPSQGPVGVFVHHNTLHAFEDEPFEDAVVHAARLLGTEPFLSESRYREELARGRIRVSDIDAVLDRTDAGKGDETLAGGRITLRALQRTLLLHSVRQESDTAVRWTLTESDVLERLRDDLSAEVRWRLLGGTEGNDEEAAEGVLADVEDEKVRRATLARAIAADHADRERRAASELWQACVESVALARPAVVHVRPPVRHRDLILAADRSLDTDELVHPLLIRLCAAFLDQGVSTWQMPCREEGLLHAAAALHAARFGPTEPWSGRLPDALRKLRRVSSVDCIAGELDRLGVPESEREDFIVRSVLALRGWAGMIRHLEERPDRAPVVEVPARLIDFVALRLVCDRVAAEWAARRLGFRRNDGNGHGAGNGSGRLLGTLWTELRDRYPPNRGPGSLARAFLLYQVVQLVGLDARDVRDLDENELLRFEAAIQSFDEWTRRRLFHLAYERRHRVELLDALASHSAVTAQPRAQTPLVQMILCIDERCESFRRHVEELGAAFETFGTPGFFAVPMYYRGVDDWHASPLCPIVTRPQHTVVEVPEAGARARHEALQNLRRRYGQIVESLSTGSRTLFRGGLFTAFAGALAAIPFVGRVAFPRLSARIGNTAGELARSRVPTRVEIDRNDEPPLVEGTRSGFDVTEMAGIVRRVLEDIGLRSRFSRVVSVLGHGSSSRNNPHESAYDCGACGGGRGGPNARVFAKMANDPRVRGALAAEGILIPDGTWFFGGMLDTCSDTIAWYDVGLVPESHRGDFAVLREACEAACVANAHERCRRFETAPLDLTPKEAHAHVEARSVDLAQVRPELGHATNAACIIGRRWRTRGLFLDRRAFLVSYDPTTDPDAAILSRTLAAVGPVGAGINLEYYFSVIDRIGYGAGTKLPHNITGLIGVMDGHASDLRTGLPWQMVEIHEPVRLLVVVDAKQDAILRAAEEVPAVKRLVVNQWIQLVAWDPDGGGLAVFEGGRFVPYVPEKSALPAVERSMAWYAGHREHLSPATVLSAVAGARSRPLGIHA